MRLSKPDNHGFTEMCAGEDVIATAALPCGARDFLTFHQELLILLSCATRYALQGLLFLPTRHNRLMSPSIELQRIPFCNIRHPQCRFLSNTA